MVSKSGSMAPMKHSNVEIESVLRLRPFTKKEQQQDNIILEPIKSSSRRGPSTVLLHPVHGTMASPMAGSSRNRTFSDGTHQNTPAEYHFNHVLPESTSQDKIYYTLGLPVATASMNTLKAANQKSYSSRPPVSHLMVCMGVANSGKTYTAFGGSTIPKRRASQDGIVPRLVDSLFSQSKHHASVGTKRFSVEISMLQVSHCKGNDPHACHLHDLLGSSSFSAPGRSDGGGKFFATPRKGKLGVRSMAARFEKAVSPLRSASPLNKGSNVVELNPDRIEAHVEKCSDVGHAREVLQRGLTASTKAAKGQNYHMLITLQPVVDGNQVGDQIAILDLAGLDRTAKQRVIGRGKDGVTNQAATAAVMHYLRTVLHNTAVQNGKMPALDCADDAVSDISNISEGREHAVSRMKPLPFRQHMVTMAMHSLFQSGGITKVTLMMAAYSGCADYHEKRMLLQDMELLCGASLNSPGRSMASTGLTRRDSRSLGSQSLASTARSSTFDEDDSPRSQGDRFSNRNSSQPPQKMPDRHLTDNRRGQQSAHDGRENRYQPTKAQPRSSHASYLVTESESQKTGSSQPLAHDGMENRMKTQPHSSNGHARSTGNGERISACDGRESQYQATRTQSSTSYGSHSNGSGEKGGHHSVSYDGRESSYLSTTTRSPPSNGYGSHLSGSQPLAHDGRENKYQPTKMQPRTVYGSHSNGNEEKGRPPAYAPSFTKTAAFKIAAAASEVPKSYNHKVDMPSSRSASNVSDFPGVDLKKGVDGHNDRVKVPSGQSGGRNTKYLSLPEEEQFSSVESTARQPNTVRPSRYAFEPKDIKKSFGKSQNRNTEDSNAPGFGLGGDRKMVVKNRMRLLENTYASPREEDRDEEAEKYMPNSISPREEKFMPNIETPMPTYTTPFGTKSAEPYPSLVRDIVVEERQKESQSSMARVVEENNVLSGNMKELEGESTQKSTQIAALSLQNREQLNSFTEKMRVFEAEDRRKSDQITALSDENRKQQERIKQLEAQLATAATKEQELLQVNDQLRSNEEGQVTHILKIEEQLEEATARAQRVQESTVSPEQSWDHTKKVKHLESRMKDLERQNIHHIENYESLDKENDRLKAALRQARRTSTSSWTREDEDAWTNQRKIRLEAQTLVKAPLRAHMEKLTEVYEIKNQWAMTNKPQFSLKFPSRFERATALDVRDKENDLQASNLATDETSPKSVGSAPKPFKPPSPVKVSRRSPKYKTKSPRENSWIKKFTKA